MTTDEKLDLLISDMQGMKSDMQGMKSDIQGMKSDMLNMKGSMATKDDIAKLEKQGNETFDELMKVETTVIKLQNDVSSLNDKYNTLLLKSDNTALLLKLIDQQADELTSLKARVDAVEQKLA